MMQGAQTDPATWFILDLVGGLENFVPSKECLAFPFPSPFRVSCLWSFFPSLVLYVLLYRACV